jgi:RPA family protein
MRTSADIVASSTEAPPTATPEGEGTQASPYNVAAVTQYTKSLAADKQSANDIYTVGIVVGTPEIDTEGTYGNATYLISDRLDGATGSFQVYRGYGLNGDKFNKASTRKIKAGDKVLIKGKVVNYKGSTPQYAQGSTIVSFMD